MVRVLNRAVWVALGLSAATVLAACSSASIVDQLPESVGGEPTGTPARSATAYEYPAVHDMPPPRATKTMDEEQEFKAEQDLAAARDRQEARTGTAEKDAKPPKKKKPTAAHDEPANAQPASPSQQRP